MNYFFDYFLEDEIWLRFRRITYIEKIIQKIKTADSTAVLNKFYYLVYSTIFVSYRFVAGVQQFSFFSKFPRNNIYSPNNEFLNSYIIAETIIGRNFELNNIIVDEYTDAENNTA